MQYVYTDSYGDTVRVGEPAITVDKVPDGAHTGGSVFLPDDSAERVEMARAILHGTGAAVVAAPDTGPADVDPAHLRTLYADATSGQWGAERQGNNWVVMSYTAFRPVAIVGTVDDDQVEDDARYIAAAHNTMPALLDALARATAERDHARADLRMAIERDDQDVQAARREERERSLDAAMRTFTNPGPDDASHRAAIVDAIRALGDDAPEPDTAEPGDEVPALAELDAALSDTMHRLSRLEDRHAEHVRQTARSYNRLADRADGLARRLDDAETASHHHGQQINAAHDSVKTLRRHAAVDVGDLRDRIVDLENPPDTADAKRPAEPARWRDRNGDTWTDAGNGRVTFAGAVSATRRELVEIEFGPLTSVSAETAAGGDA